MTDSKIVQTFQTCITKAQSVSNNKYLIIFLAIVVFTIVFTAEDYSLLGYKLRGWRVLGSSNPPGKFSSPPIRQVLNFSSRGVSYTPSADRFHIFFVWVGPKMPEQYTLCVEVTVVLNPDAEVLLFANELDENAVLFRSGRKYSNFHVVRYNLTEMVEGKPGFNFVTKAQKVKSGEIKNLELTHVHISDFMRLFLIYEFGGLYMDADMMPMRKMDYFVNSIGVDAAYRYDCSSDKYIVNIEYKKEANVKIACLCNCILSFEKGHGFMKDALEVYEDNWSRIQGYGPGGGTMLYHLMKKYLKVLSFYEVTWLVCLPFHMRYTQVVAEDHKDIKDIMEQCLTYHMFGAGKLTQINNLSSTIIGHIYKKLTKLSLN